MNELDELFVEILVRFKFPDRDNGIIKGIIDTLNKAINEELPESDIVSHFEIYNGFDKATQNVIFDIAKNYAN